MIYMNFSELSKLLQIFINGDIFYSSNHMAINIATQDSKIFNVGDATL